MGDALPYSLGSFGNRAPPRPRPPVINTISTIGVRDSKSGKPGQDELLCLAGYVDILPLLLRLIACSMLCEDMLPWAGRKSRTSQVNGKPAKVWMVLGREEIEDITGELVQ
ncbi:uncharacterized protein BJ212DRAFT_1585115 [Suillus subaureus]|uniref:Uncharacterized protein n=1 Tax=Suillus subaureus TaxID=48587 RepID=A0A9P7EKD1_9AGAM|nr:uncharacterized protein BJ212DRAFT_1585115 [Suillus subaureus]KAG1823638.1 hypothetical protein BJ212DRAFT_1585115 [Suillus subaureus]